MIIKITTADPVIVTDEIIPVIESPKQLINFGGTCFSSYHKISEYGVVFNTTGDPTIYDSCEVQGHNSQQSSSNFSWSSELEYVFSEGATYYLKAYVLIYGKYYYGDEKVYTPESKKDTVLFILKNNTYFKGQSQSYGLINSSTMISEYLQSKNVKSNVISIDEESEIDVEIDMFNPTVVIIEALWISSSKLDNLCKKYLNIEWIVRIHSNVGFLSAEYNALEQIGSYLNLNNFNLKMSSNNEEFNEELSKVCYTDFEYLPNIIHFDNDSVDESVDEYVENKYNEDNIINIGCFGASRILKNQLFQAMCAIDAADKLNKILNYHVNDDNEYYEYNDNESSVLKNLVELFKINGKHKLIIHEWTEHDKFIELIKKMDLGLQISFTESFNLITADFVSECVPILVSETISWMPNYAIVSTVDFDDVVRKILYVYKTNTRLLTKNSKLNLIYFNNKSKKIWKEFTFNKNYHKYIKSVRDRIYSSFEES